MPIDTSTFTVGTATAVKVVPADGMEQNALIHNNSTGDAVIYIGGSDSVTTNDGTLITAEERISVDLGAGDEVWAISDTAGINVRVFRVTQD